MPAVRYTTKRQLVSDIEREHDRFVALLESVPPSRRREPGVWGDGWTVNDLVAHLMEWHRMFLRWYREGLAGGRPAMPVPGFKWSETPALNRDIQRTHRRAAAATLRDGFERSYQEILALARELPPDALLKPGRFAWTGSHPLTTYLGANTSSHYRFACAVLHRWLRGKRRTA